MLRIPTALLLQADPVSSFLLGRALTRVAQVDHLHVARTTPEALAYLRTLPSPDPTAERLLILLDPYRQPNGGNTFLEARVREGLAPQAVVISLFVPSRPELGSPAPRPPAAAYVALPVQKDDLQVALRLFFPELPDAPA